MRRWTDFAGAWRAAERWLLPPECLLCRTAIGSRGSDALVCPLCRARWVRLPEPVCPRCGQPESGDLMCRICEDWPAAFGPVRSAVWLTGGARGAVHLLKYGGWPRMSESMAEVMGGLLPLAGAELLVPVPLGRKRLRERGYNQSASLADALVRHAGGEVRPAVLRRRRETRRQTELPPDARRGNVAEAFEADPTRESSVVLVDDVFTTGATLHAAASALLAAGVERVSAVTFARARRPLDDDVARLSLS